VPPEITRIDLVQGDAQTLEFHAYRSHPTAGATALAAVLIMRHQQASNVRATLAGTLVNASLGLFHVNVATAHSATAGQYRAQLVVDFGAGMGVQTVPADEPYHVQIQERV